MPLQVSRIRAICFDVDGTLSDTDDVMVAQLTELLKPFHFLFPGQELGRVARRLVMEVEAPANFLYGIPDLIGLDDEIFALKDWMVRQSKKKTKPFRLVPGTTEMLARLSKRYPLSVVSARDTRTTMEFLNQFDLVPFFKCIATDQTCEHTKPFPDPILWAAGEMGVSPDACVMVGDTSVDIRAGKAAGSQTVGVLCGFGEQAELQSHQADLIIPMTSDLVQAVGA
ncbi:MAG TPA: HAD family hydrolase [Anaerolineales bacterium]|nr:HAD family hydrolase [Anaerolineales bacterium]